MDFEKHTMIMHTVQRTTEGKFAVVSPEGETLHVSDDEGYAQMNAERLNLAMSWKPELVKEGPTCGRWDRRAA